MFSWVYLVVHAGIIFCSTYTTASIKRSTAERVLSTLCDASRAEALDTALAPCENARKVLSGPPAFISAIERTVGQVFKDLAMSAAGGVRDAAHALGLLGFAITTVALFVGYTARARERRAFLQEQRYADSCMRAVQNAISIALPPAALTHALPWHTLPSVKRD